MKILYKNLSEDLNQIFIMSLLHKIGINNDLIAWHCPNGGSRNKTEAGKLKAMGVLAGVPDLTIMGRQKIIFIELKIGNGQISKEQKELHQKFDALGFKVYTVYGDNPYETLPQIKIILELEFPYINGISNHVEAVLGSAYCVKVCSLNS